MNAFKKWFVVRIFLFVVILIAIIIITCSINPFEVNVFGHIIDKDYLEAGALLSGITGLSLYMRKRSEEE